MPESRPSDDRELLTDELLAFAFAGESSEETAEPTPSPRSEGAPDARPVTLRELADVGDLVVRPGGDEALGGGQGVPGRVEVIGEVSRGGMGIVYKARDTQLGRDVALKTLRERHAGDLGRRRRFIEEAQICSQLHHPGIVTVHEMGRLDDGRPYFLMKLITGRTLAALLKARRDPSEEMHRFLRTFELLGHAMAYAHARGVIHRDLKPSNIMVGSFGEMQVMDWGLAKVLDRGGLADEGRGSDDATAGDERRVETVRTGTDVLDSLSGSVFGTAPYMAPEQAQGRTEELDERTDVFALGAILLEILTGQPPYVGPTGREVLDDAAEARLDGGYARLDAAGVDDELCAIARACLAPDPKDRPSDAGVVARMLGDHMASVKARTRRAEHAAVAAQTRAEAERRRRRLVVALFVTILGAGAWLAWSENARRDRELTVVRTVTSALERSRRLQAEALAAPVGDLERWTYALSSARDAAAMSEGTDAPADLAAEARSLVAELAAQHDEHARIRRVSAALEEIRTGREDRYARPATDPEYGAAFRELGLDVDVLTPEELAGRVRANPIAGTLVNALDDWAFARRRLREHDDQAWRRLVDAAALADADPRRVRLRRAWASRDVVGLRDLASPDEISTADVATQSLLAYALVSIGDSDLALTVLRLAQRGSPDEYLVHHDLAALLQRRPGVDRAEVTRCLFAAAALRPESPHAHAELAVAYHAQGDRAHAVSALEKALELDPDDVLALSVRIAMHFDAREFAEAWVVLDHFLRRHPTNAYAHFQRARLQVDWQGRPEDALGSYDRGLALRPDDPEAVCNRGLVLLDLGRVREAVEALRAGHALGSALGDAWSYPSGRWLENAERALVLEPLLEEFVGGGEAPRDAATRHELAKLGYTKRLFLTAARLHEGAGEGELFEGAPCACAVKAAVRTAVGDGDAVDLGDAARQGWRGRARDWLARQLAALESGREAGALGDVEVERALRELERDRALRPVRADSGFAAVPEAERAAWNALWAAIARLRDDVEMDD